ncbi:MAG: hypothetical protein ACRDF5_12665 [bacterium]
MKRLILAVLLVFLPASTVPSKSPDASLIVPGQRIGPWTLDMTFNQLERLVGPPREKGWSLIEFDQVVPFQVYSWTDAEAYFLGKSRLVHLRVSQITRFSRTAKGIGIASPLSAVLAAYGRPTAMTRLGDDFAGLTRVIYDNIGLALRVNTITETVVAISVFRPGTAHSIWRF